MKRASLIIASCGLLLSACKVVVVAPPHVAVVNEDISFVCMPGQTCEIEVSDYNFDMSLYAVPRPGYTFLYWSSETDHLCPGFFSNKCRLSTVGIDPGDEEFRAVLESDRMYYLEPVYRRDEDAPTLDWSDIEDP